MEGLALKRGAWWKVFIQKAGPPGGTPSTQPADHPLCSLPACSCLPEAALEQRSGCCYCGFLLLQAAATILQVASHWNLPPDHQPGGGVPRALQFQTLPVSLSSPHVPSRHRLGSQAAPLSSFLAGRRWASYLSSL